MYLTRKKQIVKSDKLEEMISISGDIYSEIVVWFWRFVRRQDHWMDKSDMQRWLGKSSDWDGLHSQSIQAVAGQFYEALSSWFQNKDSNPNLNPPKNRKKTNKVVFKSGAIRLQSGTLKLSCGRGYDPIEVEWDHNKPKRVELVKQNGDFFLCCQYKVETEDRTEGNKVAGIDLGEKHLASVYIDGSKPLLFNGGEVRSKTRYREKTKAKLQSKIDRKQEGSNRWKKLVESKQEQLSSLNNQIKNILHKYSRRLVETAIKRGCSTLVVGDLRGIRNNLDYGKRMNQRLHQWVHGSFRQMVTYKAKLAGMEVHLVDEAYTSQECPRCDERNKPSGREYSCSCGFSGHRDVIGAYNIKKKYTGDDPVSSGNGVPLGIRYSPNMSCSSQSKGKTNSALALK